MLLVVLELGKFSKMKVNSISSCQLVGKYVRVRRLTLTLNHPLASVTVILQKSFENELVGKLNIIAIADALELQNT